MLIGVLTDEDIVKLLLGGGGMLLMLLSLHGRFLKILYCLCKIICQLTRSLEFPDAANII
jgi:hypothetical protein